MFAHAKCVGSKLLKMLKHLASISIYETTVHVYTFAYGGQGKATIGVTMIKHDKTIMI